MHLINRLAQIFILLLVCFLALLNQEAAARNNVKKEPGILHFLNSPWDGDLEGMLKRRHIRVLVTYSKTNFYYDGAAQRGITSDVFQKFEKWLNKRLKTGNYPVFVSFTPVARSDLITSLLAGKGDIAAAGLTVTSDRLSMVNFTDPFSSDIKEVVITGPDSPEINTIDDLSGKTLYVRRSSSYYEHLAELNKTFHAKGLVGIKIIEADENLESEDIMEMVAAGLIPMTVIDDYRGRLWAKVFSGMRVREDLVIAKNQKIAWTIRKSSPNLAMLLNEFISEYKKSDELNALGKRYFSHSRYLRNPAGSEDMRRFKDAVNYFKKYAHQYEMDYLLIAAQAYQESRIDQSKRSSRGAVGVMQILPNTADNPPISLPGIERIETNIHAGVKYHRFIIDKYFNSPDITPLNRMLFAFAAYNAGPGNLAKMRKLTKKIGLDPNTWFSNVEIAAGKVTGFETVHYVGNIYKYYVAYRLIMDRITEKERLEDERSY